MLEAVDGVVHRGVHLRLHDRLRQWHLDLLKQRLERGIADLLGLLNPLHPPHLVGEVCPQFVQSVEFACQLGEFVIGLGQFALLDRLHRDGHLGIGAGVLAGDQFGGEGRGLALGAAHDGFVEAIDELPGADLVGKPLGMAVRDRLAVDGRRQIDGHEVAGLRGAFDALEGAEPGAQGVQFSLDLLVGDLDRVDRERQLTEFGQIDVRPDVDLGGEHQFLAVLNLGDLDVGLPQRAQVAGGDGLAVAARQHVVDHLLEHRAPADPGLEQLRRRLAGPETGQPDLLGELLVGAVEVALEFSEGHLHVDAHPGGAQLLDGALHCCAPLLASCVNRSG